LKNIFIPIAAKAIAINTKVISIILRNIIYVFYL